MQLDCLAFDQHGLKRLNAKAVQCRGTVQENRVLSDNLFKNIPDFRSFTFNEALRRLDRCCLSTQLQLGKDERLKEFKRHLLRQPTLVQL